MTPMTHARSHHRPTCRGFTIIELLVAAAVTVIMLTLVGRLFTDTSNAVSRGISTSDIIASAEAFTTQLRLDADAIVGPTGPDFSGSPFGDANAQGGILIIINKRIGDWNGNNTLDGDSNNDGIINPAQGETGTEGVVFPMPGAGEARRLVRSDQLVFIKVRNPEEYHIAPADQQTFTPADDNGNAKYQRVWYGHVSRTNNNGTDANGSTTADAPASNNFLGRPGLDLLCTDWILGRQALFLAESGSPMPNRHYNGGWVSNTTLTSIGTDPPPSDYMYMGISDYAYYGLYDLTNSHAHGAIVGGVTAGGANSTRRLWASLTATDFSANDYRRRAIENYSYAAKRLRANPLPGDNNLYAWQIAQMHPYMLPNCSDFIVEWAGDTDGDGDIDTVTGSDAIQWYARFPDSTAAVIAPPASIGTYDPYYNVAGSASAATFPNADGVFVWRHDDENNKFLAVATYPNQSSKWPYLIRIRYRLHDARGQLMSGDAGSANLARSHGVWFEHVMRVSRP